jgi:hypothetical protein
VVSLNVCGNNCLNSEPDTTTVRDCLRLQGAAFGAIHKGLKGIKFKESLDSIWSQFKNAKPLYGMTIAVVEDDFRVFKLLRIHFEKVGAFLL